MLKLKATVIWKSAAEGGLSPPPTSGIQPSFNVAQDLILSRILRPDKKQMQPGIPYEVTVELPYGELYEKHIQEGMAFTLNVGARIVANGVVKKKQT